MNKPLFSIIIPCYNVANYLERCMFSVINQSYPEWECILIDDGSTDGTAGACDRIACNNDRVRVIHKNNGGVSSARNVGLSNAVGDFIVFIDPDDWISLETLKVYSDYVGYSDFMRCSYDLVSGSNTVSHIKAGAYTSKDSYLADILSYKEINRGIVFGCYKRSLFIENSITFKEGVAINEDYLSLFCLIKYANNCIFLDDTLYYYDISNSDSCCHHMDLQKDIQFFDVHRIIYSDPFVSDKKWGIHKIQGNIKSMYDVIKRLLHSASSPNNIREHISKLYDYYPSAFQIISSHNSWKVKFKLLFFRRKRPLCLISLLQKRAHSF